MSGSANWARNFFHAGVRAASSSRLGPNLSNRALASSLVRPASTSVANRSEMSATSSDHGASKKVTSSLALRPSSEDVMPEVTQPEADDDEKHPEEDGVGADEPDQRDRPCSWEDGQHEPHQDRERPRDDEDPLVAQFPPPRDGDGDLQRSGQHGPDGDEVDEDRGGDVGPEEHGHPGRHRYQTPQRRPPPDVSPPSQAEDDCHDPVHEYVRTEDRDQGDESDLGPDEGGETEEDGQEPSEDEHPPVTGDGDSQAHSNRGRIDLVLARFGAGVGAGGRFTGVSDGHGCLLPVAVALTV